MIDAEVTLAAGNRQSVQSETMSPYLVMEGTVPGSVEGLITLATNMTATLTGFAAPGLVEIVNGWLVTST